MMKAGRGAEIGDAVPVPGLPNAESQIAIPLLIRDELIGVFSIESPVRQAFNEHDRSLVSIVANQIASAIRNAQLYDERRRAAEALQAANASLEARVAERTAALERELRVAEDLLSDARSRVDGPLLGDSAAVRALRDAVAREAARTEPLLLTGPPGAGKEAVAHAVHGASGRKGAFIFVSCPELQTQSRHTPRGSTRRRDPLTASLASKLELASRRHAVSRRGSRAAARASARARRSSSSARNARAAGGDGPLPDVRLIASTTRDDSDASDLLVPLLARHADRRACARGSARGHSGARRALRAQARPAARQDGRRRVAGVDAAARSRTPGPATSASCDTVLERAILVSRRARCSRSTKSCSTTDSRSAATGSWRRWDPAAWARSGSRKHRLLARPAAVKLIRHDAQPGDAREQLVRRFQREAQVTAGLRSPHTVQLYDFGVNDTGSFYYVMELLEGLDLQRIVKRFGPQPAERVIMLLRQACRSLAEAHEHGLVHRDIKPANLFVTRLGYEYDYLKVLDFGIVKDQPGRGTDRATLLSAPNLLQGTPAFMAPEVVFGERPIDGRADLYSLACAAYWALTGSWSSRRARRRRCSCTTRRRRRCRLPRSRSFPFRTSSRRC